MTLSQILKEFDEKYGKDFEIQSEPLPYIHRGVDSSFQLSDIKAFISQSILKLLDEIPRDKAFLTDKNKETATSYRISSSIMIGYNAHVLEVEKCLESIKK